MSKVESAPVTENSLLLDIMATQTDGAYEGYAENSTGECNQVLLGTTRVIKMPENGQDNQALRSALFESAIVDSISRCPVTPPVSVPRVLSTHTSAPPYHAIYSKVHGEVLDQQALRQFDTAELRNYGAGIGRFVAWMETAISIEQYWQIYDITGRPQIYDRADSVVSCAKEVGKQDMPVNLGQLLLGIHEELIDRENNGDTEPVLVGHDDLRVGNVVFNTSDQGRKFQGVFDFGITKPSTPERELRALAPFPDALAAGIDAYESDAKRQVSRGLIGFWAIAQVATNYAGMIKAGNKSGAESKRRDLATLLPQSNWTH